jgi:rhodanese-related sulfurtransferase
MKEILVSDFKKEIDSKKKVFVLDVREEDELGFGTISGYNWIPMGQVENRLDDIPKNIKVVVYCRSGERSGHISNYLESKGFDDVWNLAGGILEWGRVVDNTVKPY